MLKVADILQGLLLRAMVLCAVHCMLEEGIKLEAWGTETKRKRLEAWRCTDSLTSCLDKGFFQCPEVIEGLNLVSTSNACNARADE